jgi:hypothetical protein
MAVTAHTPKTRPTPIDTDSTATLPISNGTPAAASPERTAERDIRWLMTQRKLSLSGSVGMVRINPAQTVEFPIRCRRQGWTDRCRVSVWIANAESGGPSSGDPLTATMTITTDTDPTGVTFDILGTEGVAASDAKLYQADLDFGTGDRTDETSLEDVTISITTGAGPTGDLYVYGRSVRQLPYTADSMELAP